jgi:uncharacterized protein YigE (DUF2233 family)
MQRVNQVVCALLLAAASKLLGGERTHLRHDGISYEVYRSKPEEVRLFWKDADGAPYEQFSRLQESLARSGQKLVFAMNSGIFKLDRAGYSPCGLHVEDGRVLNPLNHDSGRGNFYLKPNGVFFVAGGKAGVMETEEFAAAHLSPRIATQSGPLLLRRGRMHPAFLANSTSRLHRNGVGIAPNGNVIFAMTEFQPDNRVNLHGFAEFFRSLGCEDALFLDGDISAMWTPNDGSAPAGNHFAAIVGVTEPTSK